MDKKTWTFSLVVSFLVLLYSFWSGGAMLFANNKIKVSSLVQRDMLQNQSEIARLKIRIEKLQSDSRQLLGDVLEANGIEVKNSQKYRVNLETWRIEIDLKEKVLIPILLQ